jgi:hypothetical protein
MWLGLLLYDSQSGMAWHGVLGTIFFLFVDYEAT